MVAIDLHQRDHDRHRVTDKMLIQVVEQ
jgi:hypothetical protein